MGWHSVSSLFSSVYFRLIFPSSDIIDTEPSSGDTNKMLLGSFVEAYDRKDEEDNYTLHNGNTSPEQLEPGFHFNQGKRSSTYHAYPSIPEHPDIPEDSQQPSDPRIPGRSETSNNLQYQHSVSSRGGRHRDSFIH